MSEQDFQTLIAKYLAGEASPQEEFALRQWVDLDEKHEKQFEEAYASWETIHRSSETLRPDVDAAWTKVNARLAVAETETKVRDMRQGWPIWARYAAVIAVLIGLGGLIRWGLQSSQQQTLQFAAQNETERFSLPDSSQVWLTAGSQLTYQAGEKREITLEGAAFFEVERDEKHPFVIQAGQTSVEVLGTSFSVSDNDSTIEVRVATGVVAFSSPNEKSELRAGYKASFDKENAQISKSENDDFDFLPGAGRRWVFSETPLQSIIEALDVTYSVGVELKNPAIAQCRFSGSFTQEKAEAIMEVIALSLGLELQEEEGIFYLDGPGCE